MSNIVERIRADLQANADEKTLATGQRFFKEKIKFYGVKTAVAEKIAKKYWQEEKSQGKQRVFTMCEELFRSGYMEEAFVVSTWLPNLIDQLQVGDICVFKTWIERYIDNWAKCDSFCNHTIGDLIDKYPEVATEVKSWTKSSCRWLKRASAVSLILPARKGGFLQVVFDISSALLADKDDLVKKGYGWLLKEASRKHQKEVFHYIVQNRNNMPRTALRNAIELMPKNLKAEAMKKD